MCIGGKTKQTEKRDVTIDPWSKQQYESASGAVRNTLNANPFQPYTGNMVAPLNPMEIDAANYFQSNMGAGSGNVTAASDIARQVGGYSPITVGADTFAGADLSPYMNPYTDEVINASLGDLERSRSMAINEGQAAASKAGAFGGSRHGVADSLTNEAAIRAGGTLGANLRHQGFTTAAGLFGQDADRRLTADLANQGADLSAQQLRLSGAGLLGDLGGMQSDMAARDAFGLAAFGEAARGMDQAQLDAAYQEFLRAQEDPYRRAQVQLGLLGGVPVLTDSDTTTVTKQSPGALGILGTALQAGGMLSGMGLFGGGASALKSAKGVGGKF